MAIRTTAPGNDSGRYTEGNPGLGVPATVVNAQSANFWQEDPINVMEAAGLTLDATETQLLEAIQSLIASGGGSGVQTSFTIANNQAAAVNITGLIFDSADIRSAEVYFQLQRSDDVVTNVQTSGHLFAIFNTIDSQWAIFEQSSGDDVGVNFSIDQSTGQVKYTSTNFVGASYLGNIRAVSRNLLV